MAERKKKKSTVTIKGKSVSISRSSTKAVIVKGNGQAIMGRVPETRIKKANGKPVIGSVPNIEIGKSKGKAVSIGPAYLTKRILVSSAKKAFSEAAEKTMDIMGYNLIAENGWVVKVYKDGHREKIKELKKVPRPQSGKFFD